MRRKGGKSISHDRAFDTSQRRRVDFPKLEKIPEALPRQRVFYVGYRYVGPMLCQDIQDLYLKRKGVTYEGRWWAMITYAPIDDYSSKLYSLELDECHEDLVPEMLEM